MRQFGDDELVGLLKDEYLQLQKVVEDFDAKALTIKAWSVTLSAAALVAAYVQSAPYALLVGSLSALAFWAVEAFWKTSQQSYYDRIDAIEAWMAGRLASIEPLQIAFSWSESWRRHGRNAQALRIMTWPHVFMPHLAIVVAGLLLFFLAAPVPRAA